MQFTRRADQILLDIVGPAVESLLQDFYALLVEHFGITDARNRPGAFADNGTFVIWQNSDDVRVHGLHVRVDEIDRDKGPFDAASINAFGCSLFGTTVYKVVAALREGGYDHHFVNVFVVLALDGPVGNGSCNLIKYEAVVDDDTDLSIFPH